MTLLWQPSDEQIASANLTKFQAYINDRFDRDCRSFWDLHDFSVQDNQRFWQGFWDFAGVIGEQGERVLVDGDKMPGARYFPDGTLSFAENLLRPAERADSDALALIFQAEDQKSEKVTWRDLIARVGRMQALLVEAGVEEGDRVGFVLPNCPTSIVVAMAANALGAVWSSCSPDFGVNGILDRFSQTEPKVLVVCDGYFYTGKTFDTREKFAEVLAALPSVKTSFMLGFADEAADTGPLTGTERLDTALARHQDATTPTFKRLNFNAPMVIMFSSGTTGKPKCIEHGQGGVLLKQLTEHILHNDTRPDDRTFFFTPCGWMMWNWLITGLQTGATVMLYDGSPFAPDPLVLWRFAEEHGITSMGLSAKYVDALNKQQVRPTTVGRFDDMRLIASTGSTLVHESFDYLYEHVKSDVHVMSCSGGTDLLGCFVSGSPTLPVYRGELQVPGIGMDLQVYDDDGEPLREGRGELVCAKPFPSMPLGFFGDDDGSRYFKAYYERFPNVWTHGDFIEQTENHGYIIHGRSDATLNPSGVRIGTAEIYRQVETLPQIKESIVIGQPWAGDTRVVLFVVMQEGQALTDGLREKIKVQIRHGASPRHVPAKIIEVVDIPRTRSGKIVELAVRSVVMGEEVKNVEALANAEALDNFKGIPDLQED
ncbi:MAG: acetoacetate--CoA ligase [Alphaproteobacteria bacterium]|nr:acetoacetate--CoA ligase [Alphaproteobacteria bacterium]